MSLIKRFSTLEPDFYNCFFEKDIEGQDIEPYITFVVPFGTTKLNFLIRNESVTVNKEKIASYDEEAPKYS